MLHSYFTIAKSSCRFSRFYVGRRQKLSCRTAQPRDRFISCMIHELGVNIKLISCHNLLKQVSDSENLPPSATKFVGELLACNLLLAHGMKNEQTLELSIRTESLLQRKVLIELSACSSGNLQTQAMANTWIDATSSTAPSNQTAETDVLSLSDLLLPVSKVSTSASSSSTYINSELHTIFSHPTWKHPYSGIISFDIFKPISDNVCNYIKTSLQRQMHLVTHVARCKDSSNYYCIGILLEILPDSSLRHVAENYDNVDEEELVLYEDLEQLLQRRQYRHLTSIDVSKIPTPALQRLEDILQSIVAGFELEGPFSAKEMTLVELEVPKLKCTCNRMKIRGALQVLPRDQFATLISQQASNSFEIKCEHCSRKYRFSKDEIIA